MTNHKAFVCHASEDKSRFVLGFSKRLRDNGIDAWVDQWEILPGDSLVDKIFEIGLKEANAIIIILSKYSVEKKWVREEINAAFINRINRQCKLIPVVIEECDIPECLKTTLWERITDLSSYDEQYKRIELSILGKTDKPALGQMPKYARETIEVVNNLTEQDSLVFKICCDKCIETEDTFIMANTVIEACLEYELSKESVLESIEILEKNSFLDISDHMNSPMFSMRLTTYALDEYYQYYCETYTNDISNVASVLVNNEEESNIDVSRISGLNIFFVNHILNLLESKGLIKISKYFGGNSIITNVSVSLKREFQK